MSGIVGIYNLDGRPVEKTDIQRMLDSIAHRGPDGSGVWTNGSVGLGHQMLHTTPESLHEKLPLTNRGGDLTITADARIDNRDELISDLNFNGRPRETITDSEIILTAYEKWGERCTEKLLGDFAFAIWDRKNQRLFCARDPIGIKPFFYYFDGKTFYWGSEPRTIYDNSKISKGPNLQLICLYLQNRFDEREETLYKNIYRLPGSQYMVVQNGEIRKEQYWDIDPDCSIRYKTDEQYTEHFLSLFKSCVKMCLRSNGPVGVLLSGGLDSSSIACTSKLLYAENSLPINQIETFSILFEGFPCDEQAEMNEVTKRLGVKGAYFPYEKNLHCVEIRESQKYPDVIYFPTLFCFAPALKDAYGKGVRVILNGVGGDELLATSFGHLTDLILQRNFRKLLQQIRNDSQLYSYPISYLFLNYCVKPFIPRYLKKLLRPSLNLFRKNRIPPWLNMPLLRKIGRGQDSMGVSSIRKFPTLSQRDIYRDLFYSWNANIALDMVERFTNYFGVERRYPFFDRQLITFLMCIPEDQRWGGEWPKKILRNSMNGILPESLRLRKHKPEFSCIIDHEFKERQSVEVERFIQTSILADFGFIDADQFYQCFMEYKHNIKLSDFTNTLARFIWLEVWLRSLNHLN